jgi:hypothetical protein
MHEMDPGYPLDVPDKGLRIANAFAGQLTTEAALERLYKMEGQLDRMAARAARALRVLQNRTNEPTRRKGTDESVPERSEVDRSVCPLAPRTKPTNEANEPKPNLQLCPKPQNPSPARKTSYPNGLRVPGGLHRK